MADHKLFKFKLVKITHAVVLLLFSPQSREFAEVCSGLQLNLYQAILQIDLIKSLRTSVEGGKNAALADWFRFYYTGPIFQIK